MIYVLFAYLKLRYLPILYNRCCLFEIASNGTYAMIPLFANTANVPQTL